MASQQLDVYLDIKGTPAIIGTAWFTQRRTSVSTVFAYTSDHLATRGAYGVTGRELELFAEVLDRQR